MTTFSAQGPIVNTPQEIRDALVASAVAIRPGLTTDLPGTLIEDIVSTDVAALLISQQAKLETIASISPAAANLYVLNLLGQVYGVSQGIGFNTSAYVVFEGDPGYVVPKGLIVSDGTHQYNTQAAILVKENGLTDQVLAVATVSGSWAIPANTITTIVSSVPTGVTLIVTNPTTGVPSVADQSADNYRKQVMDAGLVACTGTIQAVKTYVKAVEGVADNLVSVKQVDLDANLPVLLQVIVGGGDPYNVANAIWQSIGNPGILTNSTLKVLDVSSATEAEVTTNLMHQYAVGDTVQFSGIYGIPSMNNVPFTVTNIVDAYAFTIDFDSSAHDPYLFGGVASPNVRNVLVTINDTPDQYDIKYVIPPQQPVQISILWQATVNTPISSAALSQNVSQNIVDYINNIEPGGYINLLEIQSLFQISASTLIPVEFITFIDPTVIINGTEMHPAPNQNTVSSDPQGYYYMTVADITYERSAYVSA